MSTLAWIVSGGLAMTAIALVGSVALLLPPERMQRLLLPLVAFSAGTLLGAALLHMLPGAIERLGAGAGVFVWMLGGFTTFFALEQFLHWHHAHRQVPGLPRQPLTYLVLIGDGLHNFLDGLAVGAAFVADVRLGIGTWLAAAAHEVPQELGDFAVLVHGGWSPARALTYNVLSASTFLLGGLVAHAVSSQLDLTVLLAFAAGTFVYIAASDLVPEVKHQRRVRDTVIHLGAFILGILLLLVLRVALER